MIPGDKCDLNFLTRVLQFRKNSGKNLNKEIDSSADRTRARSVTMLTLVHSGGSFHI